MSPKTLRYVLAWSLALNVFAIVQFHRLRTSTMRLMKATEHLYGDAQRCVGLVKRCDGLLGRWEKVGESCEAALKEEAR